MTRDEALKKIKKCLALSRSANEHEAGAALRQAQALMQQFGLREQDISLTDVYEVAVKACSTAANAWELRLVRLVAEAFGCETFAMLSGKYNEAGNFIRSRHWVFVGLDASPTVAGYACEVLLRQCARARLAHIAKQPRNCKAITKTTRGDAFAMGWIACVAQKVEAFAMPAKDKALLLAYIQRQHGEMENEKARNSLACRRMDAGHFAAGFHAGKSAELRRGLNGSAPQGLLT